MKKKSVKHVFLLSDLLIIATVLAIGILLLFLNGGWGALGLTIILCEAVIIPFVRHGYKIEGYPGTYRLEEIPVSRNCQEAVLRFLSDAGDGIDAQPSDAGGALVSVYHKRGENILLAQYFDYAQFLNGVEFPMVKITEQQLISLKNFSPSK